MKQKKNKHIFIYELKKYENWKNIELQLKPLKCTLVQIKNFNQFYESRYYFNFYKIKNVSNSTTVKKKPLALQ